ncbi:MAG TPA: prepilin-type N-terminal cleavage/methylation domain-containing protein [Sulfurimonas sp.]|nr:prepilin-type N-terminal cleavage/methylation domain-containing protein [Sulfurimonas sp.]
MRKAFTLVEIIFVLVVMGILSAGTFKAIEMIYIRSAQAKALTNLSLQSQVVLDQLSIFLYNRIPNSVIGYTPGGVCEPLNDLSTARPVLEWLGSMDDELLRGDYDGFVDMNASDKSSFTLSSPNTNILVNPDINLVFAGAFDAGSEEIQACSGAFGWHGVNSNLSFDVSVGTNMIVIDDSVKPSFIYEKYYLTQTAYSVARGVNVNLAAGCITDLNVSTSANTLFLFYDYQPYSGETYCGDTGSGTTAGKATVLAQDVTAFSAQEVNGIIRLSIDMDQTIRGRTCGVHVSKQKAVF